MVGLAGLVQTKYINAFLFYLSPFLTGVSRAPKKLHFSVLLLVCFKDNATPFAVEFILDSCPILPNLALISLGEILEEKKNPCNVSFTTLRSLVVSKFYKRRTVYEAQFAM